MFHFKLTSYEHVKSAPSNINPLAFFINRLPKQQHFRLFATLFAYGKKTTARKCLKPSIYTDGFLKRAIREDEQCKDSIKILKLIKHLKI